MDMSDALLLDDNAVSDEGEHSITHPDISPSSPARRSLASFNEYVEVGGVPTRILDPSEGYTKFTFVAFSADGSRFATGAGDGTVRVWRTENYSLEEDAPAVLGRSVACLSFVSGKNNVLIAGDKSGYVLEFTFVHEDAIADGSSTESSMSNVRILKERNLNYEHKGVWFTFSEDGRTLTFSDSGSADYIALYRFSDSGDLQCKLSAEERCTKTVSVSKNGTSALTCCVRLDPNQHDLRKSVVHVWPQLTFKGPERKVLLKGDRAAWGLKGEYLLLWRSDLEEPLLSVYKTRDLNYDYNVDCPLAKRSLAAGLARYEAFILTAHPDKNLEVLIHELGKSGKRRFLIWDVEEDSVTREVAMVMKPQRHIDLSDLSYCGKPADEVVECPLPVKCWQAYDFQTVEDALPKICASSDGTWIGAFYWRHHSCAISSMKSGSTVLSFTLPDEMTVSPFWTWNQASFDPSGHHFLLVTSDAIFAFAPSFLNTDCARQMKTENIPEGLFLEQVRKNECSRDVFDILPSQALGQAVTRRIRNGKSDFGFWPFIKKSGGGGSCAVHGQISANGRRAAFIAVVYNNVRYNYHEYSDHQLFAVTLDARSGSENPSYDGVAAEMFPLADSSFRPTTAFLYGKEESGNEDMVLFGADPEPVAVFCDLTSKASHEVRLDMEACLSVSQTKQRDKLVLLDVCSVCLLDLQKQQIMRRIQYGVNFRELIELVNSATTMSHYQRFVGDVDTGRRIADDGKSVLLAWTTGEEESILVTPSTDQTECTDLINEAGESLSQFCILTRDGSCTLFVDMDDLSNNRFTVGIYNESESSIVGRFHVVEHFFPLDELSPTALRLLISCLFYDQSDDGSELVTYMVPKHDRELKDLPLEEVVRRFGPYGTSESIPNYERLASHEDNIEETIKRMFHKYGSGSVFNMPSSDGTSLFQKAFLAHNKTMVDCIVGLAKEHHFQLAFEWVDPESDESTNLLKESLRLKLTNDVKEAIALLGSDQTPFMRAAAIMNESFEDVLLQEPDILQRALSDNLFVDEVCKLRVHVDYLNPRLRKDRAIHIESSDTHLEWTLDSDPERLGKMWKVKHSGADDDLKNDSATTELACLKTVRIEDAAKVGMKGIIRPLLLQKVPERIFKYEAVKWVVLFKWFKIWKQRFKVEAAQYALFLLIFSGYVILIAHSASLGQGTAFRKILATALLVLMWMFGLRMLIEEAMQIWNFTKDGQEYFGNRTWGVQYFFSSRWNVVDIASCLLLLVLIPLFHGLALIDADCERELLVNCEDWLSVILAVEAILASIKVWYFAQPFRVSGALVLMIDNIVRDCITFLGLAFVVLFGFALALHVLFRGVTADEINYHNEMNPEGQVNAENDPAEDAFGTFQRSLLTLFYALLGAFEPEIFRPDHHFAWVITAIFVVYIIAETILLLNLLIAIMGDTFDRVKSTEEAQLLMGRAKFIDACEAALTADERKAMEKQIGKYLHVLVSPDADEEEDSSLWWTGRLQMLEDSFRREIKKSEANVSDVVETLQNRMTEMTDRATVFEKNLEETTNSMNEQLNEVLALLKNRDVE